MHKWINKFSLSFHCTHRTYVASGEYIWEHEEQAPYAHTHDWSIWCFQCGVSSASSSVGIKLFVKRDVHEYTVTAHVRDTFLVLFSGLEWVYQSLQSNICHILTIVSVLHKDNRVAPMTFFDSTKEEDENQSQQYTQQGNATSNQFLFEFIEFTCGHS